MSLTTNEKLAYIAGLMDGEGSVMIVKLWHKSWNKRTDFTLVTRISNTNKGVLDWISKNYCGKVYCSSNRRKNKRWKKVYNWQANDRVAEKVLKDLLPYLIIKKERALVALNFRKTKTSNHFGYYKVPISVSELRNNLYMEMTKLNQKGALVCH